MIKFVINFDRIRRRLRHTLRRLWRCKSSAFVAEWRRPLVLNELILCWCFTGLLQVLAHFRFFINFLPPNDITLSVSRFFFGKCLTLEEDSGLFRGLSLIDTTWRENQLQIYDQFLIRNCWNLFWQVASDYFFGKLSKLKFIWMRNWYL